MHKEYAAAHSEEPAWFEEFASRKARCQALLATSANELARAAEAVQDLQTKAVWHPDDELVGQRQHELDVALNALRYAFVAVKPLSAYFESVTEYWRTVPE